MGLAEVISTCLNGTYIHVSVREAGTILNKRRQRVNFDCFSICYLNFSRDLTIILSEIWSRLVDRCDV